MEMLMVLVMVSVMSPPAMNLARRLSLRFQLNLKP